MAIVQFFRRFGPKSSAKGTSLLGSIIATCLILVLSSPVKAESPVLASPDVPADTPLLAEQTTRLDQQLADIESHLHSLNTNQNSEVLAADHPTAEAAPLQVATRIETEEMSKPEVQRLEETVVQDTYLDPFNDDAQTEIIRDPWEPMNAKVFSFNMQVDEYVLKPVATGYAWLIPDPIELAIGRVITNIRFVPRTINDMFQWKWERAGIEVGRFVINSTVGVAGLFDVANDQLGIEPVPAEDFGQTLAMHGVQPGPYLVLPLLPPTTVRDGIGTVGDMLLDPLNYFLPFIPQASMRTAEIVHERSQTLELYEGVEVATLDMYGAVRGAYSQQRSKAIRE
jgi:phospholipid-binding lipoprotein MlaA